MRLAWPVILSNLSVPLLGAVDTAVIGHLPNAANLGAVAIGTMIFSFLYWGFGFLRMGTTGFVSQANGADDANEIRSIIARALLLGLVLSGLVLSLQWPVLNIALTLVEGTAEVESGAAEYFGYRIWGAPAALANYSILGIFIGLGQTRLALVTQVFMNSVNIILDLVLVLGFDMGITGVAIATVIAEYMAVVLGLLIVSNQLKRIGGMWVIQNILSLERFWALMSVNRDIFIRTILLIFTFAYFTATAASLGEDKLAAVAVAMNFMHFLAFGLDGFAHAAESMVGNAIGAKREKRLQEVVFSSTILAVIVAGLYALVYGFAGDGLINLLTDIEEVRFAAYEFLPWLTVMPLAAVWSYQLDGIFIGAIRTREMRNGMIISFIIYFAAIQVFADSWGTDGLWLSLILFMLARAGTLMLMYPAVRRSALKN
ncbi:MATE family efflux transporter [Sneathiella limimaris]|uniref:MATE family efflux transporter n=1 Tax=Sneathiella limimaris TaxID=1964213 RepID=UPI00146E37B3|nr:MATE family efflux transporter [Sneathiella limimaris]